MKHRRILGAILSLMLISPFAARAQASLSARMCEGRLVIEWNCEGCDGGALTLYRDGWPVLVGCVRGDAGSYQAPAWYTSTQGTYTVRLRTGSGCLTAAVEGCGQSAPTAKPTAMPTAAPTAKPTVIPTAAPSVGDTSSGLASQMIALINEDRAANGVGSVSRDASLTAAACVRAKEIVEKFSHTRPDGSSWSTVYSGAYAENIAKGYSTADKCEAAFLSSQGHRENLLRANYTKVGVCAYTVGGVTYWVQLFGK